jgi:hypothetical protein
MQSSLFRCGIQGCGAKGAQSIDEFGIKKDGTRMITCISCTVCPIVVVLLVSLLIRGVGKV